MSGQILIVSVVLAGLWFGGMKAVEGAKALKHKIAHVLHHNPKK